MDDIMLGLKSTAIKFGDDTKLYLSGFGTAMIASLLASGVLAAQTWPYYATVGIIAMHISNQVNIANRSIESKNNFIIVVSDKNCSLSFLSPPDIHFKH